MMDIRNSKVRLVENLWRLAKTHDVTDTLIVWTESSGVDMALSFQEADGCAAIWYVARKESRL